MIALVDRIDRVGSHLAGVDRSAMEMVVPYFALLYETVDDYVTRRAQFRPAHLELAREAHARGELLLAGAFADPVDRALLVFRAPDASIVEDFARRDPYVTSGLVRRWEVRSWNVVIGNDPADTGSPVPAPAGR